MAWITECLHDDRAVCANCSDLEPWWRFARIKAGVGAEPPNPRVIVREELSEERRPRFCTKCGVQVSRESAGLCRPCYLTRGKGRRPTVPCKHCGEPVSHRSKTGYCRDCNASRSMTIRLAQRMRAQRVTPLAQRYGVFVDAMGAEIYREALNEVKELTP